MDWNDLRYLLAVHRHASLASAAKALQVTKATVSRRLAALEEALGFRIAERRPDGLVLTAAGLEVLLYPDHKSLVVRKLFELGGSAYASSLYLERRGRPSSREELRGHDVLVYAELGGMPGFEWLRDEDHGARIAFRANDPEALIGAATAGLGVCGVPCLLGDAEPSLERVVRLGFSRCAIHLVVHQEIQRTARIRAVTEFLVELVERQRPRLEG